MMIPSTLEAKWRGPGGYDEFRRAEEFWRDPPAQTSGEDVTPGQGHAVEG